MSYARGWLPSTYTALPYPSTDVISRREYDPIACVEWAWLVPEGFEGTLALWIFGARWFPHGEWE